MAPLALARCAAPTTDGKEAPRMNSDVFAGKWKQLRGQVKEWWGKLTHDDLDRLEGKYDKLVGVLQERYGWARKQAEDEISRRFDASKMENAGRR
jgi:uncharacterized protein YjbJ (UPF0337 family)